MNLKLFVYLLIVLVQLLGSSCVSRNVLVQNQVTTSCITNGQKKDWDNKAAKNKVILKSLKVLIVDGTNTRNTSPYDEPIRLQDYTEQSSTDVDSSLVESLYYNQLLLAELNEKLALKSKVRVLTRKLSKEVLDSLVRVDKYDVVIEAQQIKFNHHYCFNGSKAFKNITSKGSVPIGAGNSYRSITGVTNKPSVISGDMFEFPIERQQTPIQMRTIIYYTEWNLYWITTDRNKTKDEVLTLTQKGVVIDSNNNSDFVLASTARQAAKSLLQVFSW